MLEDDEKNNIIENEKRANQFLEKIRNATHDPETAKLLSASKYLDFIKDQFRENLKFDYVRSNQIFQVAFDDPNGFAYWHSWFENISITVEDFSCLLAIHAAAEHSDICKDHKDCKICLNDDQPCTPEKRRSVSLKFYESRRKNVISILLETAKMPRASDALKFEGEVDALKVNKAEAMIAHGWVREGDKLWSLKKVHLYPLDTLEWFVAVPQRAELLPKSLCAWWASAEQGSTNEETGTETKIENAEDFIKQQRNEGVDINIIAYKLKDPKGPYRLTHANIARKLGLCEDLNKDQLDAMKKRGRRACDKGRDLLLIINENCPGSQVSGQDGTIA